MTPEHMLCIHAKVGTLPVRRIFVSRRKNDPKVGDVIRFKWNTLGGFDKGEKWKEAIVDNVVENALFYLSRR